MFITSSSNDSDPFLAELVQFSSQVLQKVTGRSLDYQQASHLSSANWWGSTEASSSLEISVSGYSYAAALMPLRERDMKVLAEMFRQDAIEEIEADIIHLLLKIYPEPCWEDDPFDFLQEYL